MDPNFSDRGAGHIHYGQVDHSTSWNVACHRLPCPPEIKLKHIKQCPSDYRLESQKLKPINSPYLVGGIPTPLTNDGVRQLGWWHSQYMEK
jgi:hypothetical protein